MHVRKEGDYSRDDMPHFYEKAWERDASGRNKSDNDAAVCGHSESYSRTTSESEAEHNEVVTEHETHLMEDNAYHMEDENNNSIQRTLSAF